MIVLFIGLGSIAKRHIKNLKELYGNEIVIDVKRHKEKKNENGFAYIDNVFTEENDLKRFYDAVFITNPTALHYDTLERYQKYSNAFFIEKPVFLTGKEDTSIFDINSKIYYVACPMRYMKIIQYLKENIDPKEVLSIRCISSSYLPDWRPGVDYRNIYSANKDLGGGVSIDLIHEWDYIQYLFGYPSDVKCLICKMSNLEIDSDDVALYIGKYDSKVIEIHLDYFGKKTQRKLELICENDTIEIDFINKSVHFLCSGEILDFMEKRDDYNKRELEYFFKILTDQEENTNDLTIASKTLRLARGEL